MYLSEVLRMHKEGASLHTISTKLSINRGTIRNWIANFADGDPSGHSRTPRAEEAPSIPELTSLLEGADEALRKAMDTLKEENRAPSPSSEAQLREEVERLTTRIRDLEDTLRKEHMSRMLYQTMVDLVKENGGESLLKKSGPKQ